ncbi:MAG: transposase, partial [Patescibacteria group bacterium]|nr:transposase [Patescibacteria group bacterium]
NSMHINWEKFLLLLSSRVIKTSIVDLTSKKRMNAIVVDDSFYGRTRSKKVELLSNVYDHASKGNKFKRGFRMLTAGWTDGNTFIPLSFSLQSSANEKNRYNEMKEGLNKNSNGYKRRKKAITKSTVVLIDMLKKIRKQKIPAKHVLFDSWFAYPSIIIAIFKIKLHTIARLKKTTKIKYKFEGKLKTLNQIYRSKRKRPGRSKYLLSVIVELESDKNEKINAKIVFVRDRNNSKKWIAIISTDLELTEEEIIASYGKRWSIEVFFKMCKSYLKLSKEFQGISYDMMVAHTTIVMTRYMILSVENRENRDVRSIGELFYSTCDELQDISFFDSLTLILDALLETLQDMVFLTTKQINELLDIFISKLPKNIVKRLSYKGTL